MLEVQIQSQQEASASGAAPMTEVEIMTQVLGQKSGYTRGLGYGGPRPRLGPRATSTSSVDRTHMEQLQSEVASMRAQLAEMSSLRAQVTEMSSMRDQLAEMSSMRAQLAEMSSVHAQLAEMRAICEDLRIDRDRYRAHAASSPHSHVSPPSAQYQPPPPQYLPPYSTYLPSVSGHSPTQHPPQYVPPSAPGSVPAHYHYPPQSQGVYAHSQPSVPYYPFMPPSSSPGGSDSRSGGSDSRSNVNEAADQHQ